MLKRLVIARPSVLVVKAIAPRGSIGFVMEDVLTVLPGTCK